MFPVESHLRRSKERIFKRWKCLFAEGLSGLCLVKLFDAPTVIILKVRISRNRALLGVVIASCTDMSFSPDEAIGILDARSLGYYKIHQQVLQQNPNKYQFQILHRIWDQFNDYTINVNALHIAKTNGQSITLIPGWNRTLPTDTWQT